jgi:hypothetical protein
VVFHPVGAVKPPPPREVLLELNVIVLTSPSCSFCGRKSVGDHSSRAKPPWSATVQARRRRTCSGENREGGKNDQDDRYTHCTVDREVRRGKWTWSTVDLVVACEPPPPVHHRLAL